MDFRSKMTICEDHYDLPFEHHESITDIPALAVDRLCGV